MKPILVIFAFVTVVVVFFAFGGNFATKSDTPEQATVPPKSAPTVTFTMLFSPEKRAWLEWARDRFIRVHPDIEIVLETMGSLEAANAIRDGSKQPRIWSPSSTRILHSLDEAWVLSHGHSIYDKVGPYAPVNLVHTSIVFMTWESRANAILAHTKLAGTRRLFAELIQGTTTPNGWKNLGGQSDWGAVKLRFANPLRASLGLDTLFLVAMEQHDYPKAELTVDELDTEPFKQLLEIMGDTQMELPSTAEQLTDNMLRFGPKEYDIVLSYENLAITARESTDERWEPIRIIYPPVMVGSDNPAAILDYFDTGDERRKAMVEAEKQAATVWLEYLLSHESQLQAIAYGFRPSEKASGEHIDPVTVTLPDEAINPFAETSEKLGGVDFALPPRAPDASGQVIQKILQLWRTQTHRSR